MPASGDPETEKGWTVWSAGLTCPPEGRRDRPSVHFGGRAYARFSRSGWVFVWALPGWKREGLIKEDFGITAYATIGSEQEASVGAMGCYGVCLGGFKNIGEGGGATVGVGTPGVFIGGQTG